MKNEGPFLGVVIPAFNEEARIAETIGRIREHLSGKSYCWEVLVADDGSTDQTGEIVSAMAAEDARIRLLSLPHGGKGWAVKYGMLQSRAEWRFLCDADLSMSPEQIDRFIGGDGDGPDDDVLIGSREAPGAQRFDEPSARHVLGRAFNYMVQMTAVRGLNDTQCGFKLFRGSKVTALFTPLRLHGFAFDVEVLFLARKAGLRIREVPIDWRYHGGSKMRLAQGAYAFGDILKVRLNDLLGRYKTA